MTKRTVAGILIVLLLLPAVISAGSVLFAQNSLLEYIDSLREDAISQALGNKIGTDVKAFEIPETDRYIVRFKESATDSEIEKALKNVPFSPLADSKSRLFAISTGDGKFISDFEDIIDYAEPDLLRETQAYTNDPIENISFESVGVNTAWEAVSIKSEIIVAVLDTGVDRSHEDLRGANILAGYDAVEGIAGVDSDPVGHGTGIIGIIAAVADNELGTAGVASGVTVLPIKISSSSTAIYSSALIAGIRFAADSGAKIINLSVGGYSPSYAEQEAINYAASKGCILIAAAGNGGNRPYADQKSYPASYEGVISVASCAPDGSRSDFSQYNDAVDVAAPGEMINMPIVDSGESLYRADSGTSYSCALVSGIAALALSAVDDGVRFDNDEFLSLIIDSCGSRRDDELGYGIINAYDIVSRANLPIITGAVNGATYSESIKIGFNRGTATLDGDPFNDGDTVMANGSHYLVVTDGEIERTVRFKLDHDPLKYEFKEFASFSYFDFDRGSAFLDGFPYKSGERISAGGKHLFRLIDGEEYLEKEIYLQYSLPEVFGIEDGMEYTSPVDIRIIGDGSAFLDGKEVYGEAAVAESGKHTLTVKSGNGANTKNYNFTISFPYANIIDGDYETASAAVDEENGYFCLYGESLVGARIYDIESPEKYKHFLPVGRVYSHALLENELLLFGDGGVTVIDRKSAPDGNAAVVKTVSVEGMTYYTFANGAVYCFGNGNMYTFDIESETAELFAELDFECEVAFFEDGKFYLLSPSYDRLVRILESESKRISSFEIDYSLEGKKLCFGNGYLAVGNKLIELLSGNTVLEFCSVLPVMIENGLIYTESRIIDIASGRELASFPFEVSSLQVCENSTYLFGVESDFAIIGNEAEGFASFGAADRIDKAFSLPESINDYRTNIYHDIYQNVISAASGSEMLYMLFENRNILYSCSLSDFSENEPVPLRYSPNEIFVSGGYITVSFESIPVVYVAPESDIAAGVYIELPSVCVSAAISNGILYAIAGGRLVHCSADGSEPPITFIRAERVQADSERIYLLSGGILSVYTLSLSLIAKLEVNGDDLLLGSGIAVGNTVYDPMLNLEYLVLEEKIKAYTGDVILTERGLYDALSGSFVGSLGTDEAEITVLGKNKSLITITNACISSCSFGDGSEITVDPAIDGITDGKFYLDSVVINYQHGIGFLDGKPFESGSAATGAGNHIFHITLPGGRSVTIGFTIEAYIDKIEFLSPSRTMSVGETISLRVRFLPEGASSVPVVFTTEDKGISVDENGVVTAHQVGVFTVTAKAETEYGVFESDCKITVRDDLIVFLPDSELVIDRDNGYIFGTKSGITAEQIKSLLQNPTNAEVIDKRGEIVEGIIGTGDRLVLHDGSNITDELKIVIIGDTDGDGYITAYDLYTLERILKGYYYDAEYVSAADINRNGIIADTDHRILKEALFANELEVSTPPPASLFGLATVQTVTNIASGDIIDVAVCISGCKYALGVSGVLGFGDGLEFIDGYITGWDAGFQKTENGIAFYAHDPDGEECGSAFKLLLNLRFRVTAEAGSNIDFSSEGFCVAFKDGCRIIRFEPISPFVYSQPKGDFGIEFLNAYSFEFDPEVYEYSAVIPYNAALADIRVFRGDMRSIDISSLVVSDSGYTTVTVTAVDQNGTSRIYSVRVRRDNEPRFDSNCMLADLEVEGHKLTPKFDPEIYEYDIAVPYGTEKINIYCVAQSSSATVIIGDTRLYGDKTRVTVTVGAPAGESAVYTLNVTVLPRSEESDVSEPTVDPDGSRSTLIWLAVIGGIAAIALFLTLYFNVYKRAESKDAEESEAEEKEPEKSENNE